MDATTPAEPKKFVEMTTMPYCTVYADKGRTLMWGREPVS